MGGRPWALGEISYSKLTRGAGHETTVLDLVPTVVSRAGCVAAGRGNVPEHAQFKQGV